MSELAIPEFGRLLAPYLGAVPPAAMPRFLALLERGAAARYRAWADELPEHAEVLLACSRAEDEIADRIDAAFDLDDSLRPALEQPLADAVRAYYDAFAGHDVWDQLRIQANAERQGSRAWEGIATRTTDPAQLDALAACSALEVRSAERLDALIARHSSTRG